MKPVTKVEIEKSVPFPAKYHKSIYPFAKMKVGDSFFVEKKATTVGASFNQFKKIAQPEWDFTCRKEGSGVRVWRIK